MRRATYHVHTTFCDGENSPEEMIQAALNAKMSDIGFTAHTAWPFATEWHLAPKRYREYLAEIERLRKTYADKITITSGFEADYLPGISVPDHSFYAPFSPDFLIGSVHYIRPEHKRFSAHLCSVDAPLEEVAHGLASCFDNDGKSAAQAYWRAVRDMVSSCDFDIIGHLDVLRKRNGTLHFFNENASWYRRELEQTVKTIARSGKIVELNTGGIARKAMESIYPSDELLALLSKHDVPITISSDAHTKEHIAWAYDTAIEAAKKAGFTQLTYKNSDGWKQEPF